VQLPANAIDSGEILDEPGIASNHVSAAGITSSSAASLTDLISTTITIPSSGYVVVSTSGEMDLSAGSLVSYQISETPNTSTDLSDRMFLGSSSSTFLSYETLNRQRVYAKSAGTYTFYLEAYNVSGAIGSTGVRDPMITATYYPTSYGGVTTLVSAADAKAYPNAQAVVTPASNERASATLYEVDLRGLELRESAQREALAKTEIQLARARLAAGVRAGRATPVTKP
jgi:hypothetical protein